MNKMQANPIPIAKEGFNSIIFFFILLLLSFLLGAKNLIIVFTLLTAFMFWFFRDPERKIPLDPKIIVAPADGKIMAINQLNSVREIFSIGINEKIFLNQPTTQIIIYLSPFDVHLNRAPIEGKIIEQKYIKGKFFPSFSKNAGQNERNYILFERQSDNLQVLVVQIAGFLTRRIVSYVRKNDQIKKGERIGLIKFGSRTDLFIPQKRVEKILIKVGEKVKAGETGVVSCNMKLACPVGLSFGET